MQKRAYSGHDLLVALVSLASSVHETYPGFTWAAKRWPTQTLHRDAFFKLMTTRSNANQSGSWKSLSHHLISASRLAADDPSLQHEFNSQPHLLTRLARRC